MSEILTILPSLAAQFVLGFILIGLFVQSGDKVAFWKPILTSFIMVVAGIIIELYLSKYLYQGTLAMQWMLFVILGHKLCSMPLDKSMMAQFCFFSFMLGIGLFQKPVEPAADAEEVTFVEKLQPVLLPVRMASARSSALGAMYDVSEDELKPIEIAFTPKQDTPEEPEDSSTTSPDTPPVGEPLVMTGSEFEDLFYDTSAPPMELVPLAVSTSNSIFVDPADEQFGNQFEELTPPTTLAPDDSEEIVQEQNRSTDSEFTPPGYIIGAVSFGKKGSFAMVDGRLLREGAILRTGTSEPRGWKLYKITETDLFW